MKNITTIIFDLGGVLIDWSPEYVYLKEFRGVNQDAGYPIKKATEERIAMFPEYRQLIEMYYGRWEEMLGFAHEGTLAVLKQLKNNPKYRVLALTNWSGETWPKAIAKFPWLQWFEGILVSGDEGMRKPFPEIYELMLSKYKIAASEAVFIDDSYKNIEGCEAVGITGIHFTNTKTLTAKLRQLNIDINP